MKSTMHEDTASETTQQIPTRNDRAISWTDNHSSSRQRDMSAHSFRRYFNLCVPLF